MAAEKSDVPFPRTGQTPIEAGEGSSSHGALVIDPTVNEKTIQFNTAQENDTIPPPAYSEDVGRSISETSANPSTSSRPSHLRKPIAIPAIDAAFDSPFIRAYPPMLKDYKLPKESFLTFLDNLNQVIASSPPLQVLDAAGGILSLVPILFPLHWVGSAVSGIANLGSFGVSKGRTESAIRQANKDIFGPRGLKVEIAKLDALAHLAGIPILDSRGKVNRQVPLLQPLMMEANVEVTSLDVEQQCLKPLQPWIADLEIETLPWTSKSKLTRFNAALKKHNGTGRSDDRSLLAQRQRLADECRGRLARASEDYNKTLRELNDEEEKARSSREGALDKVAQRLSGIAQGRNRNQRRYDEEVRKINEEYAAEDRDERGIRKILWLIIRDLEADSGVMSQNADLNQQCS